MRFLVVLALSILQVYCIAQQVNDRTFFRYKEQKELYSAENRRHTAFKKTYADSIVGVELFEKSNAERRFAIRPLLDLSLTFEASKIRTGAGVGGELRYQYKKWNSGFRYLFNRQQFVDYQNSYVQENGIVLGMDVSQGLSQNFVQNNYVAGYLNFEANKYFTVEAGFGRNFIGDGYRSLLRSDASGSSPYLKIQTKFWNIEYTNLFSSHRNIFQVEGRSELYQKKYTASHYLDWRATKWFSIGVFETIIWGSEEGNYTRGFDVNYANPFIFYRPVEFSVGSSDNVLVGANVKLTVAKNNLLYSQLLFDEFLLDELRADFSQLRNPNDSIRSGWWANKYGVQFGWTSFDLFKIKGLQARAELNLVRPYTYAHSSVTQAYSHDNISLAHPLGANFYEYLIRINYEIKRWNFALNYHQNSQGRSSFGENYGENLQLSNVSRQREYENELAQGERFDVNYVEATTSYLLSKKMNTTLSASFVARGESSQYQTNNSNFIMVRIHSNLFNKYFDY